MSDIATLAKPYAKAAYEFAVEHNVVARWHDMLKSLQAIIANEQVGKAIASPEATSSECAAVVIAIAGDTFDQHGKNFINCLAENKRLLLASAILSTFEAMKARDEKVLGATVATAVDLSDEEKQNLKAIIEKKSKCKVTLDYHTDKALIAGAVITIGDKVIDGSIRTQLSRMAEMFN